MSNTTRYDVTDWPVGDAFDDVGHVLNDMIAHLKRRQEEGAPGGGKPGAVIHIPPGDYRLRTQVVIDVSFLRIEGAGHGFASSSIRFNVPETQWGRLHELWPGGSRILVDLPRGDGPDVEPTDGAAFVIARDGEPRLSAIEFVGFCIDGLHFESDGSELHPENTYTNGKTGIYAATANDSVRVNGMGFVYLEHALVMHHADALSIHDNFIAECGSCVELRGWGQASKITDNLIGAGFAGHSIYAENHGGLLVSANNVFPRGASSVHLRGVTRSSVTANRLHSFSPGMVVLDGASAENLVAANHFLRDREPWTPFLGIGNGRDDEYGLLRVEGDGNSLIANHFSAVVAAEDVRPTGAKPVIIRIVSGTGNYVASTHVVARDRRGQARDDCFAAQVDALLSARTADDLPVIAVLVDSASVRNTVLDAGTVAQLAVDTAANAVRPTPEVGA